MAGWVAKLSLRHARFRPPFHHAGLSARWHHTQCGRITSRCLRRISPQKPSPLATWDGCDHTGGILEWKHFITIHFPFPMHPRTRNKVHPYMCLQHCQTFLFLMLKFWVILIIPEILSKCIAATLSAVQFWVSLLSHKPWPHGYSKWCLTEAAAMVLHLN